MGEVRKTELFSMFCQKCGIDQERLSFFLRDCELVGTMISDTTDTDAHLSINKVSAKRFAGSEALWGFLCREDVVLVPAWICK